MTEREQQEAIDQAAGEIAADAAMREDKLIQGFEAELLRLRTANADLKKRLEREKLRYQPTSEAKVYAASLREASTANADLEARLAKAEEREKVLVEAIKTATTNAKPTLGTTDMGSAVIRRMHYLYQMDDHLTLTKAALAGIPLLTGSENKGKAEEDKP